jgi:phosphoribosylformylglycinamidine synthase subunit PurS
MIVRYRVVVRLRPGILDVQGAAVKRALDGLGFSGVTDLRIGKVVEVELDAPSEADARQRVDEMCRKLLTNPILEDYVIEPVADLAASGPER